MKANLKKDSKGSDNKKKDGKADSQRNRIDRKNGDGSKSGRSSSQTSGSTPILKNDGETFAMSDENLRRLAEKVVPADSGGIYVGVPKWRSQHRHALSRLG